MPTPHLFEFLRIILFPKTNSFHFTLSGFWIAMPPTTDQLIVTLAVVYPPSGALRVADRLMVQIASVRLILVLGVVAPRCC